MVATPRASAHSPEWYVLRRTTVTASNSAHLMLDKSDMRWKLDEADLLKRISGEVPFRRNEAMHAGTHFEMATLDWLSHLTGAQIEPDGALWLDDERPWMGASPDAFVEWEGAEGVDVPDPSLVIRDPWGQALYSDDAVRYLQAQAGRWLVETKVVRSKSRYIWKKEEPPAYYANQVQHQMCVLDLDNALLVAKVDAYEMWGYHIERSQGYCELLEAECKRFWEEHLKEV